MFDLEWTGRSYGDESDCAKAVEAAQQYCARNDIDPAAAWQELCAAADSSGDVPATWRAIEAEAFRAMFADWEREAENVQLVWR